MILEDLSIDLLLNIGSLVEQNDHKNLRLVCSSLADTFSLLVLKSICICIKGVGDGHEAVGPLDLLRWLGHPNAQYKPRIQSIRKLSITSLSPANHLDSDSGVMEDEVVQCLRPALRALENVHTFTWEVQDKDPVITHTIVAEAVSSYRQLDRLHVYLTHLTTPILHHFKDLVSIELSLYTTQSHTLTPLEVLDSCAQAIMQSPGLSSFTFTASEGKEYFLHHIFQQCRTPLAIRNLSLNRIWSPYYLLPHIHNLKHIDMTNVVKESGLATMGVEEFWVEVKGTGIKLEHIRVDHIPETLVDYLKWYHGLKSFTLSNDIGPVDNRLLDDAVAEKFYFEGLSNHTPTLEVLDLHLKYEDKWCFNPGLSMVIAMCGSLRRLGLGFGYGQLAVALDNGQVGCMHVLFRTIAQTGQHIQNLSIYSPLPKRDSTAEAQYRQSQGLWQLTEYTLLWMEGTFMEVGYTPGHYNARHFPTVYMPDYQSDTYYVPIHGGSTAFRYQKCRK